MCHVWKGANWRCLLFIWNFILFVANLTLNLRSVKSIIDVIYFLLLYIVHGAFTGCFEVKLMDKFCTNYIQIMVTSESRWSILWNCFNDKIINCLTLMPYKHYSLCIDLYHFVIILFQIKIFLNKVNDNQTTHI